MMPVLSKSHDMFGKVCYFRYIGQRAALLWSQRSRPSPARLWAKLLLGQARSSHLLRKQEATARKSKRAAEQSVRQQIQTNCWKSLGGKEVEKYNVCSRRWLVEVNSCC